MAKVDGSAALSTFGIDWLFAALKATQRQMNGFFSQLPYECHLEEAASVYD
jgi:hypothetical protein